jgi:hypothetical protein
VKDRQDWCGEYEATSSSVGTGGGRSAAEWGGGETLVKIDGTRIDLVEELIHQVGRELLPIGLHIHIHVVSVLVTHIADDCNTTEYT